VRVMSDVDVVESVCHDINQALSRVNSQNELDQVIMSFIHGVGMMQIRLFKTNAQVEYDLMVMHSDLSDDREALKV